MAGEMTELTKTAIGQVLMEGDGKKLRALLKNGGDVFYTDRKGNNYLHLLATTYRPYLVYILVAAQLDINTQNRDGNTPLHVTALQDECCHVTDLMACGADPSIKNKDGKTAAEVATNSKYWKSFYTLYEPGLREAIRRRDAARVEYLLQCWCSIDVVLGGKNMRQYAAALTFHDLVQLIDQYRFSIMAAYGVLECDYDKLRYALTRPECDVNLARQVAGVSQHTMLQHAILQKDRRLVDMLVDAGADVTAYVQLSEYLRGPLFFEVLQTKRNLSSNLVDKVLSAPLDPAAKDEKGRSAVIFTLDRTSGPEAVGLVQRLLELGVDIGCRDDAGYSARDVARFYQRQDIIDVIDKCLVRFVKSSNIDALRQLAMDAYHNIFIEYEYRDTWIYAAGNETEETLEFLRTLPSYWETAETFHKAVVSGDDTEVKRLLNTSSDPTMILLSKDQGGRTPLMKAVMHGHQSITQWLVNQHGPVVHQRDNSNRTALHYAYGVEFDGNEDLVELLLRAGADRDFQDVAGFTPQQRNQQLPAWVAEERQAQYGPGCRRTYVELESP